MHSVLTSSDGLLDVVIHAQSSSGMEIASQLECIDHGLAVGHVGQDAQLQLAIVSNHKGMPLGYIRCESFAHLHYEGSCEYVCARTGEGGGGGGGRKGGEIGGIEGAGPGGRALQGGGGKAEIPRGVSGGAPPGCYQQMLQLQHTCVTRHAWMAMACQAIYTLLLSL